MCIFVQDRWRKNRRYISVGISLYTRFFCFFKQLTRFCCLHDCTITRRVIRFVMHGLYKTVGLQKTVPSFHIVAQSTLPFFTNYSRYRIFNRVSVFVMNLEKKNYKNLIALMALPNKQEKNIFAIFDDNSRVNAQFSFLL